MDALEIVLLIAGGVIFILSFLIPSGEDKNRTQAAPVAKEEIREMVNRELESVKSHVDDVVEEAVTYAVEKTERSLERLSNDKIMAVSEYSDTVLAEIHKNHEEAMFLYDMLNSKHTNIKNTVSEVNRTMKEAEEKVSAFQRLTPEKVSPPKAAFVRLAEEQMSRAAAETVPDARAKVVGTEKKDNDAQKNAQTAENSNDRIIDLYRQGMDTVGIARELGLGVGEVKLVLDLFVSQS